MATRVILLVGCSGSGKSTYAREQFPCALVVSADHYFESLAADNHQSFEDVWNLYELGTAHSQCERSFMEALSVDAPLVIVDNTNVRPSDRQRYVKKALGFGSEAELHVFSPWLHGDTVPTPDQIQSYVERCHERNAHGVPLEVVAQQFDRLDLPSGIYRAGKPAQFLRPLPAPGVSWLEP